MSSRSAIMCSARRCRAAISSKARRVVSQGKRRRAGFDVKDGGNTYTQTLTETLSRDSGSRSGIKTRSFVLNFELNPHLKIPSPESDFIAPAVIRQREVCLPTSRASTLTAVPESACPSVRLLGVARFRPALPGRVPAACRLHRSSILAGDTAIALCTPFIPPAARRALHKPPGPTTHPATPRRSCVPPVICLFCKVR